LATAVPKHKLINAILETVPEADIRAQFRILRSQNLTNRLASLRKSALELLLRSSEEGFERLKRLEERYPQNMPSTFYLVKVIPRNYTEDLPPVIKALIPGVRDFGLNEPNRSVRVIYLDREELIVPDYHLIEIPLVYELKLEFSVGDPPDSDSYGEIERTYILKRAFVWLLDNHSHGLVCCSDMAGLNAIIEYFHTQLSVSLSLPDMTQDIFSRLIDVGKPSSATFRGFPANMPTISVYASGVGETEIYQELAKDEDREQVSGFFRGGDNAYFASFGISRNYARIWTPWKYSKPRLMWAATQIMNRTEEELSQEFVNDISSYVKYFSGVRVEVGEKTLSGQARIYYQKIIEWIVRAQRVPMNELEIIASDIIDLIKLKNKLDLEIALHFDCPNCGGGLSRCPHCLEPHQIKEENGNLVAVCTRCRVEITDHQIQCECGTDIEFLTLANHIRLHPGTNLQQAINKFTSEHLDDFDWHGTFVIDGLLFKTLALRAIGELPPIIHLTDLLSWQRHARIHQIQPREALLSIVNHTKEKCHRDNRPPNQALCDVCLAGLITEDQIRTRREVCSPRIMGIAINQQFDGIHHGHEVADIRYRDHLVDGGNQIDVGIHLKSRQKPRVEGLGRSVYAIKSLYTQIFYSAFQALMDQDIAFDVIGISIPNQIHPEVINSIQSLLNQLGFSLLVIEEDDWLRIFDAALTNTVFKLGEGN